MASRADLQDRVSPNYAEEFQRHLDNETTRQRIINVVAEYVGQVEFMEKVQKYAAMEYENRILKSARFWGATVVTAIITAVASSVIALLIAGRL